MSDSGPRMPPARGEVANLIEARDWSQSPLGPPESWSASLRATVGMLLTAHTEIVLFWGPEFVALYNDSYFPTIGDKHPRALGRPARENWAELWDDLEPLLRGVRETGETFSAKDRPFYIERHGYGETVYFDISYSVVPDDDGSIGGVLCIVSETTQRVLAERRLRESETRFRALVSATSDVIYRISPEWAEMRELQGRDFVEDTTEPRKDWLEGYIPTEDHPAVEAQMAAALAERRPYQLEHRVLRKDGTIGWTASRAVPIMEDGEIIEWFGAAADVTERYRAQERLRLIVHELNHRVKNNLAMVQSIASQTFRKTENLAEARERFSERLVALGQANDLLTGARGAGASLQGAIEHAVEPYQHKAERFHLAGPEVLLTAKTALAIALAMHELATNAVKYGAWSNDHGRVTVEWSRRPGEGDEKPRLHLEWREEEGPPVSPPERRGFGSRLIERGLAGELNGRVELLFDAEGLRCVVDAPLPAGNAT